MTKKVVARQTNRARKKPDADAEHKRRDDEQAKREQRKQGERVESEFLAEYEREHRRLHDARVDAAVTSAEALVKLLWGRRAGAPGPGPRFTLADIAEVVHDVASGHEESFVELRRDESVAVRAMAMMMDWVVSYFDVVQPAPFRGNGSRVIAEPDVARAEIAAIDFGLPLAMACRLSVGDKRRADALRDRMKRRDK